ncbi:OmpA family protein [Candidatus Avelusimicrobium facis]|uniref:OmpA family protein n=1 Tax=Candidatus Avelusimicrobium facis TaxID=3416203 RepID=UPI0015B51EA8
MKKIILPVLAGCLMLSACTTPGKRTAIGAGGGAAVGALAGAIIANNTGGKSGQGALYGALAGAAAGGLLGNYYDKQAQELAQIADVQKVKDANGKTIRLVITLKNDILFETGNAALSAGSVSTLNGLLRVLKKYPKNNIIVAGYTDSTGSKAVNDNLSIQRAKAVYDYLMANNLRTKSIQYTGYGSANPVASNSTAAGRAKNRRVELLITANEKDLQ